MTFALTSAWPKREQALADLTWPNKVAYARRHGYYAEAGVRENWHWSKLDAIEDVLYRGCPGCEWVCWMDCDTLVMNQDVLLESFVDPYVDMVCSYDVSGLNAGVLFWRNCEWTKQFLKKWREIGQRVNHGPLSEQTILAYWLVAQPPERWRCVPQRNFNSYRYAEVRMQHPEGEYQAGDFLLHLAGVNLPRRLQLVRELLPQIRPA
ncbi:MAG TPA: hypothetical protein VKS79_21165 [Gemmataceae bacterium]|nr:hypothetical protein [Gemmataceae bacterium]